jgi:hypothetical protein
MTDTVTPEQIDVCLDLIAIAEPVRKACHTAGITPQQFYRRMLADETIAERYARAKEAALDAMADDILAISDDGSNDTYLDEDGNERTRTDVIARSRLRVDSRKWIMSKLAPKKWGDKVTQEHTGPDGGPVQVATIRRVVVDPANPDAKGVPAAS